ncbi:MAG: GYD domain-containing protein [Actinomycetota bacterium]
MPVYVTLFRWTDQGRQKSKDLPARYADGRERIEAAGGKEIGTYVTMGQYDMVSVVEAPNDEAIAKIALGIAGRGNASTETLRAFTMDEVKGLL